MNLRAAIMRSDRRSQGFANFNFTPFSSECGVQEASIPPRNEKSQSARNPQRSAFLVDQQASTNNAIMANDIAHHDIEGECSSSSSFFEDSTAVICA